MDTENRKPMEQHRNKGFTIIELLVAMAIGSIIIGVAIGFFKTVISQNTTVTNSAFIQEEAFFVSHVVKQQMAQIGYRPLDLTKIDGRATPLTAATTAFPEVAGSWLAGQTLKISGTAGLSYRYYGASTDTLDADASIYDCLGNAIAGGIIQENEISVIDKQLVCTTGASSAVIMGAEDGISVLGYGYDIGVDDDGDDVIDRVVGGVTATDEEFINTKNITLRLLLATPDGVTRDYQTYFFNGNERVATDRKFRSETEISMTLRN